MVKRKKQSILIVIDQLKNALEELREDEIDMNLVSDYVMEALRISIRIAERGDEIMVFDVYVN